MERYRIKPGTRVKLSEWDADDHQGFEGEKEEGEEKSRALSRQLETLQELLYAEHKHKVLVVLQGMDTSGKDGVIRHVFEGVNPQGVRVANFKVPTPEELDHDYLWRIHKHTPGKGEIVIFNRSHYEDVLVVRVHELVPETIWKRRYQQINDFERLLAEEGTTILKFFLFISLEEQKKQLQERLDDPTKQWKFNPADVEERKRWPQYMRAYEDVISLTSTDWAPWYIVPSNRRWYRNLVIGSVLVATLRGLKMEYPKPKEDLSGIVIE
ncbi:MAG: polyphosphate kinase 2 family protein [Anaerolineales bacterium]|nr:polyphosphate kinase 2 family protein [Anaerolineales bacterium]